MQITRVILIVAVAGLATYISLGDPFASDRSKTPSRSRANTESPAFPGASPTEISQPAARHSSITQTVERSDIHPPERLLKALAQASGPDRDREIRLAMNAWIAADGAAALAAARQRTDYADIYRRMARLIVQVYPELLLEDPTALDDFPDKNALLTQAIYVIAQENPEWALALLDANADHLATASELRTSLQRRANSMPGAVDAANPRDALQAALSESDGQLRRRKLMALITGVASENPELAAQLLGELSPGQERRIAAWSLINAWMRQDPGSAARWIVSNPDMAAQQGLTQVASTWGQMDFDAATTFADQLSGSNRSRYLLGLTHATAGMSQEQQLAWIARYQGDPVYPQLVAIAAQRVAREDPDAAIEAIAALPPESQAFAYQSILPNLAMRDSDMAFQLFDEIADDGNRERLAPMMAAMVARTDPVRALEWAQGLEHGRARDAAVASAAGMIAQTDPERAKRAIAEISDKALRRQPVMMLVLAAPSDDAAISLGREYDLDRTQVLQIRSQGFAFGGTAPAMRMGTRMAMPAFVNETGDALLIENH